MQRCNGFPVAKISDEPEKAMCQSPTFLAFLKELYNIKEAKNV
jgi:nicotinate phosphoribosyltransferase